MNHYYHATTNEHMENTNQLYEINLTCPILKLNIFTVKSFLFLKFTTSVTSNIINNFHCNLYNILYIPI